MSPKDERLNIEDQQKIPADIDLEAVGLGAASETATDNEDDGRWGSEGPMNERRR